MSDRIVRQFRPVSRPQMGRLVSVVATPLLVLAVLASPSQAAAPCQAHEIRFDGEASPSLGQNLGDGDLINAVASLIRNRLGLPLPASSKAYVCIDETALIEELLRNFGVRGLGAWGSLSRAAGVATPVGVFFRGDYLVRAGLTDRVAVVAHELAHMSQRKLAKGGETGIPLWIREGHAEWVAFRVLDLLGLRAYGASRDRVVYSVISSTPPPIKPFPDLHALTARTSWTRSGELGRAATYGQAFLAVDWLVERYGDAKLVEYLRRFEFTADSQEHWGTVFPIPYGEFVDDFRVRLKGLVPAHGVDDVGGMSSHG